MQRQSLWRRLAWPVLSVLLWCQTPSSHANTSSSPHGHKVLRMAHTLDQNHVVHKSMLYLAERLAFYSHGELELRIYPGGQLGSERELIELLQIGSLAMTKVSASPLEGFAPGMKVFSVPYVFRNEQHLWQVLEGPIGQQLLADLTRVRLKGLGYYDAGSRSFYTTKAKINTPADLQGLKFRVPNSQTSVSMVQALGGAATPVDWGELYTALQQGVVDGAENNPPSFYSSRHYELSKYYVLDEHTSVPDVILMSQHVWQQLSPEQQQWLTQAFADSVLFERQAWQAATSEALLAVQAAGVELIYPDKTPFQQAVKGLHHALVGTEVGKLIEQIQALPSLDSSSAVETSAPQATPVHPEKPVQGAQP